MIKWNVKKNFIKGSLIFIKLLNLLKIDSWMGIFVEKLILVDCVKLIFVKLFFLVNWVDVW